MRPRLWRYERMASAMGYQVVAGVDEVGMGPLAGPVVGGAVVLPIGVKISGLDDSKLIRFAERERLDTIIRRKAVAVSVCAVDHAQVCSLGLTRARHLATAGAVAGVGGTPRDLPGGAVGRAPAAPAPMGGGEGDPPRPPCNRPRRLARGAARPGPDQED